MEGSDWTLKPKTMGRDIINDKLIPMKIDIPLAPKDLLHILRCDCKTRCSLKRCTCRKHGLECTLACGEFKGLSCFNSPKPLDDGDDDLMIETNALDILTQETFTIAHFFE